MIHFHSQFSLSNSLSISKNINQQKILQDDNLKIMDNFEWATITLSTSAAIASRNDILQFSRATITHSTSAASIAYNAMIHFYSHGQQ